MQNQLKVLLTIQGIPGSKMVQIGKKKVPFELKLKELYPKYNGKNPDKIGRKGHRTVNDTMFVDASKSIKLTLEAYNYMTGRECPSWFKDVRAWHKLKKEAKLEQHLNRICQANNGSSFSYNILDD